MEHAFGKAYKLCSVKQIERLFADGKKIKSFPIYLVFQESKQEMQQSFQVLFSVPKKQMKLAHDRNYVKRCMREALRLNKSEIENHLTLCNKKINFALVYQFNERIPFHEMEQKLISILAKLKNEIKDEKQPT